MDISFEVIDQSDKLEAAVNEIEKSGVIALDIESNSRHHYPEQLCLIQLATPRKVYIIDTLAVSDISSLWGVLLSMDTVKVFHEASNDLRSLDRHHGILVRSIFDTAIAARFIGIKKHGLGDVIYNLLGVDIEKSKRLQKSDWGRRPLSDEALEYAAADVYHLISVGEELIQRLNVLGRMDWVTEECVRLEELRYEAPDPEEFYRSIKGAGKLKGPALAILRQLYQFREEEAVSRHRPPFYIMPDQALVYLAEDPYADLSQVPGLGEKVLKRLGPGIRKAVKDGLSAPPVKRKRPARAPFRGKDKEADSRLKALKEWRMGIGNELSLDPSLIWPTVSLERLAGSPDTLEAELMSDDVRDWQTEQFSSPLAEMLKALG